MTVYTNGFIDVEDERYMDEDELVILNTLTSEQNEVLEIAKKLYLSR